MQETLDTFHIYICMCVIDPWGDTVLYQNICFKIHVTQTVVVSHQLITHCRAWEKSRKQNVVEYDIKPNKDVCLCDNNPKDRNK